MKDSKKARGMLFIAKVISFIGTVYIKEILASVHMAICNIGQDRFIFLAVVLIAIIVGLKK